MSKFKPAPGWGERIAGVFILYLAGYVITQDVWRGLSLGIILYWGVQCLIDGRVER